MRIPVKLSEMTFVDPDKGALVRYREAPIDFVVGQRVVGFAISVIGLVPLVEYIHATPTMRGELMSFEGAEYCMLCGENLLAYNLNWN
jgi:hypothetical protein